MNYMDWELYAWLKRGSRRRSVLNILSSSARPQTSTEIKSTLNISLSQSSFTLKELVEKGLVDCINPSDHIGKLYKINSKGRVLMELDGASFLN